MAKIEHDAESLSQDNNPLVQPFKDNLYEAFSSRLFVDECDFDTKLQAYNDVEKMCKAEIEILHDMVKSTIEEEKAT